MAEKMHILYSLALGLSVLLTSPWWLWQMLRSGKYRTGLRERLGRVPARLGKTQAAVWVHAVSVGEVLAMSTTIARLRDAGHRVVVSTTTDTGQNLARQRFGEANVFYFPLDFDFAVQPYLRSIRPSLLVLAEAEFWPNVLRLAGSNGARIAVVNARISDRSFPRYRRFRGLIGGMLAQVDVFLAQSRQDAQRLIDIGADPQRVSVAGNLKFDVRPPSQAELVPALRNALQREQAGPVIVAGSTLAGEEEILLDAFTEIRKAFARSVLVLAPRHPERFATVGDLLASRDHSWMRRSEWEEPAHMAGRVLLLDSIGELAALYEVAQLAFVGGSLIPAGGHNIVEPARFGVPVLVGPYTENFREIVETFRRADAVVVVDKENLAATMLELLRDDANRAALGARAADVVGQNSGATARTVDALLALLQDSSSRTAPPAGSRLPAQESTHASQGTRS
jgi:3-deoxy-D-manno-octulosonic-acid transferase